MMPLKNFPFLKIKSQLQSILSRVPPFLVFMLCLATTFSAVIINEQMIQKEEDARFEKLVKSFTSVAQTHFEIYINALISTKGLFDSSENVTREEFAKFVADLKVQERFPGIQGIGYTIKVPKESLQSHIKSMHYAGFPKYQIWPSTPRDDYFSIVYLEPLDWRNKRAIGYDMTTEPTRKTAMERARDTGDMVASGPVTLVQETKSEQQIGFLIYAPIYEKMKPLNTIAQRQNALIGYVYSPFRAGDLFTHISRFALDDKPSITVRVYNSKNQSNENLFFASHNQSAERKSQPRMFLRKNPISKIETFPFLPQNEPWTIVYEPTPDFFAKSTLLSPLIIGILGFTISLLIYFILLTSQSANQAKSRFLAAMSHEIRTPLGIIIGFAELALDSQTIDNETQKSLISIKKNGEQLINLIGDVLDLAKIEANKVEINKQMINFPALFNEIVQSFTQKAKKKGLQFQWECNTAIPEYIFTDSLKLRQIIVNIIGNALKFTDKGSVKVTTNLIKSKGLDYLQIQIQDTGIGISENDKFEIFEPFRRAHRVYNQAQGGTGLGLALSRQLAALLGIRISLVKTVLNQGSTFEILIPADKTLPLWQPTQILINTELLKPARAPQPDLTGFKILIAEDSLDNQALFTKYLSPTKAQIYIANDGKEACEMAEIKSPDLILMDIQMPNMNGIDATILLRKRAFKKPIVALTAHAFKEEREEIIKAGFDHYLTKPISRSTLVREIENILLKINAKVSSNNLDH